MHLFRNRMRSLIKVIRIFRFILENEFVSGIVNIFYIFLFFRNLISIFRLVHFGYLFNFIGLKLFIFKNSIAIGSGNLLNGLYKLKPNQPMSKFF
jgi:hypothetical protein